MRLECDQSRQHSEGKSGFSGARVFGITVNKEYISLTSLSALLNSELVQIFMHSIAPLKAGAYYSYSSAFLDRIPIPDFLSKHWKELKDELRLIADELFKINSELINTYGQVEKERKTRRIGYLQERLNDIVYTIYNISEKDRIAMTSYG